MKTSSILRRVEDSIANYVFARAGLGPEIQQTRGRRAATGDGLTSPFVVVVAPSSQPFPVGAAIDFQITLSQTVSIMIKIVTPSRNMTVNAQVLEPDDYHDYVVSAVKDTLYNTELVQSLNQADGISCHFDEVDAPSESISPSDNGFATQLMFTVLAGPIA